MRIGTWNLEGRWSDAHRGVIDGMSCDVLLLTEVPLEIDLPELHIHRSVALMGPGKHWSAVAFGGHGVSLPDPHPASAAVELDGVVFCCSVLPWLKWRDLDGSVPPWSGTQAERMASTLDTLVGVLRDHTAVVWGGDWNTPLSGSLTGFSRAAQRSVLDTVEGLDLTVPTAELESAQLGCLAIDHVAVPRAAQTHLVESIPVPRGLSDHWGYVVETDVHQDRGQAGRDELKASPAALAASAAASSVVGT